MTRPEPRPDASDLETFWDLSDELLSIATVDGTLQRVNDRWERTLGWSREELLSRPLAEVVHPDDRDRLREGLARLGRPGARFDAVELRFVHADGSHRWLSINARTDDRGERILACSRDVTSLREWEREQDRLVSELERSNADLEQFAATASHDLTSPLVAARGFVEYALDDPGLSDESRELLRRAHDRVNRGVELTTGILRFSRVGTRSMSFDTIDLEVLLRRLAQAAVDDRGDCTVEVDVDVIPAVHGDAAAITTLFHNLVENAVKFSPVDRPCRIRIAGEHVGERVRVTIDDEGPGIAEDDRERVFAPFVRATEGHQVPGSGLGLATCRRIVERHGGTIALEEAPGGGTRVVVHLPAAYASTTRIHPEHDPRPAAERLEAGRSVEDDGAESA